MNPGMNPLVGELAQVVPIVSEDTTAGEIDQLFRRDEACPSIVIQDSTGQLRLVPRTQFEVVMAGPFGFGRALHTHRPGTDMAVGPLVLHHDDDLLEAADLLLARHLDERYEDSVVVGPGGAVRVLPVGRVLGELARLYRHQARHDPLTGLPNRAAVVDHLERALARTRRAGQALGVFFLDIDRFKSVNDLWGHATGDAVLQAVANRLRDVVRTSDVVGRLGGDEFVVLADLGTTEHADDLAGRMRASISRPLVLRGQPIPLTCSVGCAIAGPADTADDLLVRSDSDMYLDKGRDDGAEPGTPELLAPLRQALSDDAIDVHYQPIVDLQTGAVHGVEALARWNRDRIAVPPTVFVGLAETHGLIHRLGRLVLEKALAQVASWRAAGHVLHLSVNLSPHQLADPQLAATVAALLHRHDVPPCQLTLELTESSLNIDDTTFEASLSSLHDLGVRLSVDDFGTGTSGLYRLSRLPFDEVKVDRNFVGRMLTHAPDRRITEAIVALAASLGLRVVAEGIETRAQARAIAALEVPHAQGYLWAHPQPAAAISELLPVLATA